MEAQDSFFGLATRVEAMTFLGDLLLGSRPSPLLEAIATRLKAIAFVEDHCY